MQEKLLSGKPPITFDNILSQLDGFGPYQKWTITIMCFGNGLNGISQILSVLTMKRPDHYCYVSELHEQPGLNMTQEQLKDLSIPDDQDNQCSQKDVDWEAYFSQNSAEEATFEDLENFSNQSSNETTCSSETYIFDSTQISSSLITDYNLVCSDLNNWTVVLIQTHTC